MAFIETFRASPQRRQILVVAIVGMLLCAALAAAYFLFLRTPYQVLFTKLRTMDAATIVAELDKRKTPYRLSDGGQTILVPGNLVDSTRLAVMSDDLPLKGTVGFELFNKSDMGLTEFAQRINYQRALQGELARTIMTMESVDGARVHISLAEPSLFRDDRRPPKASVTIVPKSGMQLSPETIAGVQRLVAAAVPELATADVVVLDEQGRIVSNDGAVGEPTGAEVSERTPIDSYYEVKIRRALAGLYPNGGERISVSAIAGGGSTGDAALEAWTPASRSFGLNVLITSDPPPTPEAQSQIHRLVEAAIGANPDLGDAITVAMAAGPEQPVAALPATTAQAMPPPQFIVPGTHGKLPSPFATVPWNVLLALLLLLVAGVLLLRWRRAAPPRLTESQRAEYVRRLKAELDGEQAYVAHPL